MNSSRLSLKAYFLAAMVASAAVTVPLAAQTETDEWTFIGPLGGGIIQSVAINQNNCDSIYAVSFVYSETYLHVTGDQGGNWDLIETAPEGIGKIIIDPERTETLFGLASGSLYRSDDAGISWIELSDSLMSFAIDPQNSSRIFVGSYGGIVFRSTDSGTSWSHIMTGASGNITAITVDHSDPLIVYAGVTGGFPGERVFKSTDGGNTWSPADSLLPETNINVLVIDPVLSETIYIGTAGSGVWRSANSGTSWEEVNTGLPVSTINVLEAIPGQNGNLYVSTWSDGDYGFYESIDGGDNWIQVDLGFYAGGNVKVQTCPQEPDALFIGSTALLKTNFAYDSVKIIGVVQEDITAAAVNPYDTDIIYAGLYTIYKSIDGGSSWDIRDNGFESLSSHCKKIVIDYTDTDVIYMGHSTWGSKIYKSVDGAATWDTCLTTTRVNDIVMDPHDHNTLYAGGAKWLPYDGVLYKTTDAGASWDEVDTSVTLSIAIDPDDPATIYTGTETEGVKKSTDGGASWSYINHLLPKPETSYGPIHAIAVDSVDPNTVYCSLGGAGVYKSTNGGGLWFQANAGLPSPGVNEIKDIDIDPHNTQVLYACIDDQGVYRSTDEGLEWYSMNTGLPSGQFVSIELDPVSPNIIYLCSIGGLFRYESTFDPTTDDEAVAAIGRPDAFINGTVIEYSLELPCHVRMKIYDVAGREVADLLDQRQGAGSHTVGIKTDRLSSGVYFVKMSFGSRSMTKKYILIR